MEKEKLPEILASELKEEKARIAVRWADLKDFVKGHDDFIDDQEIIALLGIEVTKPEDEEKRKMETYEVGL